MSDKHEAVNIFPSHIEVEAAVLEPEKQAIGASSLVGCLAFSQGLACCLFQELDL
jgi:hypothetical protein